MYVLLETFCQKASLEMFLKFLGGENFWFTFYKFYFKYSKCYLYVNLASLPQLKNCCQKLCSLLVMSKPIQEEFCGFLKQVGCFILHSRAFVIKLPMIKVLLYLN